MNEDYLAPPVYRPDVRVDKNVLRLHFNENLYGPSPQVASAVSAALAMGGVELYSRSPVDGLIEALAKAHRTSEWIGVTHGASEAIRTVAHGFRQQYDTACLLEPTWAFYSVALHAHAYRIVAIPLIYQNDVARIDPGGLSRAIDRPSLVMMPSPLVPFGHYLAYDDAIALARVIAETESVWVLDGTYEDFEPVPAWYAEVETMLGHAFVRVRSFSKFYALAQYRVGYILGCARLGRMLEGLMPVYGVGLVAATAAVAAIASEAYYVQMRRLMALTREQMRAILTEAGNPVFVSDANFIATQLRTGASAQLEARGVLTRDCGASYAMPGYVRITVPRAEDLPRLRRSLSLATE